MKHEETIAKKEIEVYMKLDHKNILKYYYFEEKKDKMYLVIEKCICSLNDYIDFVYGRMSGHKY